MKIFLLTFLAAAGLAATASAQLAEGSVFPYPGGASGGLTAVNAPFTGIRYNLDRLSNAGYTIFIDISATWCPPCWAYHQSKQLDTLWAQHGPAGAPGVNATTTNDVFVLFFQGESTSGIAELTDNAVGSGAILYSTTELPYSNVTQGNWVTGTPFPMIDDTTSSDATYGTGAIDAAWDIAFFPTVYMICRDHLVHNLTQPSYTAAYAAAQADCPTYAPSSTYDAKATTYMGSDYYVCNANPSVTFQNYSSTNSITTATVTVTDATGATVATLPWSGTLAPFAVATVPVPSFAGTSFGGYKYSVTVPSDSNPANNSSVDSVFKVYSASNAGTIPYYDDLTGAITYKYSFPSDGSIALPNPAWSGCPNPAGVTENKYLLFDFYDFQAGTGSFDFVVGNFNTTGVTGLTFQFDEAYAEYTGNPSDAMAVQVSSDCGATWTTPWTASGTALETAPSTTSQFVPASASQWQHITTYIPNTDDNANMMVKLTGTSAYGNFGWVTNLDLKLGTASVPNVISAEGISIAPNPAKDVAYVNLNLTADANVQVQVLDAVGRVINTISQDLNQGAQKIDVSTNNLPAGMYLVKVIVGNNVTTKQLSVIK